MPLPQPDPSLPSNPVPLFSDIDAARGDHLRALCQKVWQNLQYLYDFTGRTTDTLTEGVTNLYFLASRVLASALSGFSIGADSAITSADTVLQAFGKAQGQITGLKDINASIAILAEDQTSGTASGSFLSGARRVRVLNTNEYDLKSIVADFNGSGGTSANQFKLNAGTYYIKVRAPAYNVAENLCWLRNVTDSADALVGQPAYCGASTTNVHAEAEGVVTIASAKIFQIEHQCIGGQAGNGFGTAGGFGSTERYTVVFIHKIL